MEGEGCSVAWSYRGRPAAVVPRVNEKLLGSKNKRRGRQKRKSAVTVGNEKQTIGEQKKETGRRGNVGRKGREGR